MPVTKKDLLELQKNIILEIGNFLEKHVIEPIFDLKKDVGVLKKDTKQLKHDVEQIDRKLVKTIDRFDRHSATIENHEKRITSLETPNTI